MECVETMETIIRQVKELSKMITGSENSSYSRILKTAEQAKQANKLTATHQSKCGRYFYKPSGEYYPSTIYRKCLTRDKVYLFWDEHTNLWKKSLMHVKNLKKIG